MSHVFRSLTLILPIVAFHACVGGAADADPQLTFERPNIVVILADDFGYECVGANGGTSYSTPHLNRLANSGARYEHCYTQPLCTPTRAQLLTGQLNVRNYVRFGYLDPQVCTFAQLLQRSGYATGVFGKWQLGNGKDGPKHFGFDEHVLWQLTRRPPRYANPGLEIQGVEVDFSNGEYGPDLVQNAALKFISKHHQHPFLLFYPMLLTHAPFQPTPKSEDWDPKAVGEEVRQNDKHFANMVEYLDGHVGQIVDHLETLHLRERTLILFVGDNGTKPSISSQWNGTSVQGGKSHTTDAGMRVPLIVNWPGHITAGQVVHDLVDTTDFLPTICDAAKVDYPKGVKLDGRSLLPSAMGQKTHPRDWLYSWYWPNQNEQSATNPPVELARNHRYKLYGDGSFFELDGRYGEKQLDLIRLDDDAIIARRLLEDALAQFKHTRPESLVRPGRR